MVRGLLFNTPKDIFKKNKNGIFIAVIISAAIFGSKHISSAPGETIFNIGKVIFTFALGLLLRGTFLQQEKAHMIRMFPCHMGFAMQNIDDDGTLNIVCCV